MEKSEGSVVISSRFILLSLVCALSACMPGAEMPNAFNMLGIGGSRLQEAAVSPPPGYEGRYWVDQRGCSFIRTGQAPDYNWVPQVDTRRKQICDPSQANKLRQDEADAVRQRFRSLGFPVIADRLVGRPERPKTVDLGPFTVASALEDARIMAVRLGYPDAFTYLIQ